MGYGCWFREYDDAAREAQRRAALTRMRYRVFYEPANRWWNVYETNQPLAGEHSSNPREDG